MPGASHSMPLRSSSTNGAVVPSFPANSSASLPPLESLLEQYEQHVESTRRKQRGTIGRRHRTATANTRSTTGSRSSNLNFNNSSQSGNGSGGIQSLLDFALIAFPKASTSSVAKMLADHNEVVMWPGEPNFLHGNKPTDFIRNFYNLSAQAAEVEGDRIRRRKIGYKTPTDLHRPHVLRFFARFLPATRILVGIRHPILLFESFYNFRARDGRAMPDPADLVFGNRDSGRTPSSYCTGDPVTLGFCVDVMRYHSHLANLGKTERKEQVEIDLLGPEITAYGRGASRIAPDNSNYVPNPVFLYEVSQLRDDVGGDQRGLFLRDLSNFVGLKEPLVEVYHTNRIREARRLDICDGDKYLEVRGALMEIAVNASTWIRNYFLRSPDVTVSSPAHFDEILRSWTVDPCTQRVAGQEKIETAVYPQKG